MIGGIANGGISIQPWETPRLGGDISRDPSNSTSAAGTPPQGLGSTGMGGGFAQWPGNLNPAWGKGLFGGWGERGVAR